MNNRKDEEQSGARQLMFCLCRPTVTLHQGQSHRHEYEHNNICHAELYRHAKVECHSLNIARDTAIIVQVKHFSRLRRRCDLE